MANEVYRNESVSSFKRSSVENVKQSDEQLIWAAHTGQSNTWMREQSITESNFGGDKLNQDTSYGLVPLGAFSARSFSKGSSAVKANLLTPDSLGGRKGKVAVVLDALHEFADISTLHGMRYVLAADTNIVRRFLWLALVGVFCAIVTYHCLIQYTHYTSKPTSINVNKVYTNSIEFPAVTICNDNVFRISAAHEHGLLTVIEKLFTKRLTLQDVYNARVANMTMDKINYMAGNSIENMLISCKWQGRKECGAENFSSVLTDNGLCFSFNGPDYPWDLRATSPGVTHGLELVLNIEEYERMAGPNVGSGIHIFVQNKRDYPLVEQKGQAIAAGSHTFIALSLKKEKRLGWPYDNCLDWRMEHVSNVTYKYSMATCQVDCYVTFIVHKCGCKDFYFPGNFPVCTWVTLVTCLKDAKNEYEAVKDKVCKCYNPCNSEYMEPLYSYSALSKDVHNVLNPGDTERIMKRFKWALGINEYYSKEHQYKKNRYRNFTQSVNRLQEFYELFGARIDALINAAFQAEYTATLIMAITTEVLTAQACLCEKAFMTPKMAFELDMIHELLEDHRVFGNSVKNQIKAMNRTKDNDVREVMHVLLQDDIYGRMRLVEPGLNHIFQLATSYKYGIPMNEDVGLCDKFTYFNDIEQDTIIPSDVLKEAVFRAHTILTKSDYSRVSVKAVMHSLEQLLLAAQDIFASESATVEQMQRAFNVTETHSAASISYLTGYGALRKEMIEWPSDTLVQHLENLQQANKECQSSLDEYVADLKITNKGLVEFKDHFKEYRQIIPVLNHYLIYFNVSKFRIAEMFSGRNSEEVHTWMERMKNSISLSVDNFIYQLKSVIGCYKNLYADIFKSTVVHHVFEANGADLEVNERHRDTVLNQSLDLLSKLDALRIMKSLHTEHLALAQDIQMDANQFTNQAVIDVSFYGNNFIFLNIFFSEISYTITEQQMAYDYYNIISDIGGSMGLLIGGSIVSLFEILDFVICLCVSLMKGTP